MRFRANLTVRNPTQIRADFMAGLNVDKKYPEQFEGKKTSTIFFGGDPLRDQSIPSLVQI